VLIRVLYRAYFREEEVAFMKEKTTALMTMRATRPIG
jgi:hypothetical protein